MGNARPCAGKFPVQLRLQATAAGLSGSARRDARIALRQILGKSTSQHHILIPPEGVVARAGAAAASPTAAIKATNNRWYLIISST
jgi:hypothetical protein